MSELRLMQCAWRRVLPFAAALAVGFGLTLFIGFGEPPPTNGSGVESSAPRTAAAPAVWIPTPLPTVHREPPSIHVLSPILMSEVQEMKPFGKYADARILPPHDAVYAPATRKDYKQGVLQVNFLFGTDGVIHDVVPVEKRVICGPCLEGERMTHSEQVVRIDKSYPHLAGFVEAAAAALGRIEFIPAQVAGHPYPTHGFAECVFRLD